jgi:hypothetical protein
MNKKMPNQKFFVRLNTQQTLEKLIQEIFRNVDIQSAAQLRVCWVVQCSNQVAGDEMWISIWSAGLSD